MCACASNHPVTCALLLSHNADLCAMNDRGMTVFHLAAFLGSLNVLQELLTSSSNDEILKAINQGDHLNQTPLFYACIEGHLDIALTLLRAGANVYHLDNEDQTCLHAMLSSSIILKRHIRLFYSFIQFVDYRSNQDYLGRTLLDLAYLNQSNTIISLLILLNYKTNSEIVFNSEQIEKLAYLNDKHVLSLRHTCILYFKRSINYQRNQRQPTQHDLLENALQQTFQITSDRDSINIKENQTIESSIGKSLDDISLLQQPNKYQKNVKTIKSHDKKLRKTASIFSTATSSTNKWSSQIDLQHTQSTWSALANKFKGQRLPPVTTSIQQTPLDQQTNLEQISTINPMKNLALDLLTSSSKLDNLLDFPSLNNNHLLNEDLKMSMNTYNLLGTN
jgi:ankyrin repeat protein